MEYSNNIFLDDYRTAHSIRWLKEIQNQSDGGWGMYEHHPSRIVTTAEALSALSYAGITDSSLDQGRNYLLQSSKDKKWCQYTRHHAWIIFSLSQSGPKEDIPNDCIEILANTQVNGSWSHIPNSRPSIFATFIAWRALTSIESHPDITNLSCQWVMDQFQDGYWALEQNNPSYSATSFAAIMLSKENIYKTHFDAQLKRAKDFLLSGVVENHHIENEQYVSGDGQYNFHHYVLPWVLIALLELGVSPYNSIIIDAYKKLTISHYSDVSGGWSEEESRRPTVFATSHTIAALSYLNRYRTFTNYLSIDNQLEIDKDEISKSKKNTNPKNIFIVHGHDKAIKQEVARYIERLELNPIILDEQIDPGTKTLFDKFRDHATRADYAIVLLSPDDISTDSTGDVVKRARQNVLYELGYFVANLGEGNVCIAKNGNVEIPSDILGVVYEDLTDSGWKYNLAKKLEIAGFIIDYSKI